MSETVIKVENISKQYRLGQVGTGSLNHDINRWWHKMRGKEDPYVKIGDENDRTKKGNSEYVWALQDINFSVKKGEVLGIIGKNGAGKSTLLKILSRTTAPTIGKISIKGRVASLLEVGTGFHPELSGRANIFLNGAILGMTRQEIQNKFDEIVDFSGVERYIDTPVKRYSSGMYVRLAFAVAAHLEPEVLIVDEVLAVGDAEFQKKCLGKMKDVSINGGRTVLFVSHNMGAITTLCDKGLLLNNGKVEVCGDVSVVVNHYFQLGINWKEKQPISKFRNYNIKTSPAFFEDVFVDGYENEMPQLNMGEPFEIVIKICAKESIKDASVALAFYNSEGVKTDMTFSWDDDFYLSLSPGIHFIKFTPNNLNLPPDKYTMAVGLNQSYNSNSWDGISYYPILEIENRSAVKHWEARPWAIHHMSANKWKKIDY